MALMRRIAPWSEWDVWARKSETNRKALECWLSLSAVAQRHMKPTDLVERWIEGCPVCGTSCVVVRKKPMRCACCGYTTASL
jgi:hypothetical protein